MTITPTGLSRAAGIAAVLAGLIFIGVQINHPPSDVTSVATGEWAVRNSLKVLMAALALAGITGVYLRQVRRSGVLGLLGYLLLCTGYLLILSTAAISAYVVPSLASTAPGYVDDVLAAATNGAAAGDIGLLQGVLQVQSVAYLAGGLVFGVALYRARVVPRWAAVLLALGGVATVVLAVLPDAFYRFLAFPNGLAMIGLGYALWRIARADAPTTSITPPTSPTPTTPATSITPAVPTSASPDGARGPRVSTAGAE